MSWCNFESFCSYESITTAFKLTKDQEVIPDNSILLTENHKTEKPGC